MAILQPLVDSPYKSPSNQEQTKKWVPESLNFLQKYVAPVTTSKGSTQYRCQGFIIKK